MCLYTRMTVWAGGIPVMCGLTDSQSIFTDSVTKTSKSSHLMIQQRIEGGENKQPRLMKELSRSIKSRESLGWEDIRNTWTSEAGFTKRVTFESRLLDLHYLKVTGEARGLGRNQRQGGLTDVVTGDCKEERGDRETRYDKSVKYIEDRFGDLALPP